jgi:enoyl-CoA hydratase/carnithine racemase
MEPAPTAKALEPEESVVLRSQEPRGVITLTLNRPQAFNALSEAMLVGLQREFDAIAEEEEVRVVVLAAEGKAFCAGHDLKEMRAKPSLEYYERLFSQCSKMMLAIQRLPVPVIARIQGIATAAGCQLVGMCDLAVAASSAKFAVSGVNLGLFCSAPGVALCFAQSGVRDARNRRIYQRRRSESARVD